LSKADGITSHPYFWAGYVTIGNSDIKFEKPKRNNKYWYGSVFLLLSVMVVFIIYRREKQPY